MEQQLIDNINLFIENKIEYYSSNEKYDNSKKQFEGIKFQFNQLINILQEKNQKIGKKIEVKQQMIDAYKNSLLENKNLIEHESLDIKLNIFIVLTMLEQIKHPNYDLDKMENDIDIIKTYILVNLYSSINRSINSEILLNSYINSEKNLKKTFNFLGINIDYLTQIPKRFMYENKFLLEKFPDFQFKYIKRLNSEVVEEGSFNELFRRSLRLALSEIEIMASDEKNKEIQNVIELKKRGYPDPDIELLSYKSKIKTLKQYLFENEISEQQFKNFND